ncbi:hypothetical protein CHS0354_027866, partial [Potamilus streckersoni]
DKGTLAEENILFHYRPLNITSKNFPSRSYRYDWKELQDSNGQTQREAKLRRNTLFPVLLTGTEIYSIWHILGMIR